MQGLVPPAARGGLPWLGHMLAYGRNPFRFVEQVAAEHGDVVSFVLLGRRIVLLTGDRASELFYRSGDDVLDQSAAYRVMTPIFGDGVLYDAPPQRREHQLAMLMPPLRAEAMREHAPAIVAEVADATSGWGAGGELDLVDFMQRLTVNTATRCLLGPELRFELNSEFTQLYRDLEGGVSPLAYYFPNLPLPKFRRRDAARRQLRVLVDAIVAKRAANPAPRTDMLQALIDTRYPDGSALTGDEIAGILIGAVFAGHHTSAGTGAWLLIELLRHPPVLAEVRDEVDRMGEPTMRSLHSMPVLEATLKEVLRLHPPVIILMRRALTDLQVGDYAIHAGDLVWASPPVTHRRADLFAVPGEFDPGRFDDVRREDRNVMAYQPFGGGRHRCAGSGFAAFQLKAITAMLLNRFDFELVQPPSDYVDDYRQMIVQPRRPCRVRYRARGSIAWTRT